MDKFKSELAYIKWFFEVELFVSLIFFRGNIFEQTFFFALFKCRKKIVTNEILGTHELMPKFFKTNDSDIKFIIANDLTEKPHSHHQINHNESYDEYKVLSDHKVVNDANEITVKRGDIVYVLEESLDGFWKVMIAYHQVHRGIYKNIYIFLLN